MIKVENLTKRYAGFTAVDNLNFHVEKGEIVGFLGPNGAGKSTTMRILSTFLPATSGRAMVAGYDVFHQSMEVRRRLGYMPENVPLYPEMRVREYLAYRASLKEITGRRQRERIGDVLALCSLSHMENRLIHGLSKGYRQRVGLADALLHSPDLLILDEPTIGLDPNQIRQVRELIRNLSKHHTILLSTHILPEVEMTCKRVIIINQGRIEAADTPENLIRDLRSSAALRLEAKGFEPDQARDQLLSIPEIREATFHQDGDWTTFTLRTKPTTDPRVAIWELAKDRRWTVRELSWPRPTLEEAFVEITLGDEA